MINNNEITLWLALPAGADAFVDTGIFFAHSISEQQHAFEKCVRPRRAPGHIDIHTRHLLGYATRARRYVRHRVRRHQAFVQIYSLLGHNRGVHSAISGKHHSNFQSGSSGCFKSQSGRRLRTSGIFS